MEIKLYLWFSGKTASVFNVVVKSLKKPITL